MEVAQHSNDLLINFFGDKAVSPSYSSAILAKRVSGRGRGRQLPVAGSRALSAAVYVWDLLKITIISITSTIAKQKGGNTALLIGGKLD